MDHQSCGLRHFHFFLRFVFRLDSCQFAHRAFPSCRVEHLYHFLSAGAAGTVRQVRFYGLFEAAAQFNTAPQPTATAA